MVKLKVFYVYNIIYHGHKKFPKIWEHYANLLFFFDLISQRERETETETETDRQTDRHRQRQTDRVRERERLFSLKIVITLEVNDHEIGASKALSVWNVAAQPMCM